MNTHMLEHDGRPAQPGGAGGARRALRRSRRGVPGVRVGGEGPAGGARGRRGRGGPACCGRATARCAAGASLVTRRARPTRTSIPVRFVGNRSSGRMGYAIAAEAAARGAEVVLVAGPGGAGRRRRRARWSGCGAPPRCTTRCWRARRGGRRHHGRRRRQLHARSAARAEDRARRRAHDADARRGPATSWPISRAARGTGQPRVRCSSASPRRPTTWSSGRGEARCARAST